MNTYAKFYTEKLYPVQDGVLNVVKNLKTPFHLTGGTALSRHYLNHRYSDAIDLFVINDSGFSVYAEALIKALDKNSSELNIILLYDTFIKTSSYIQLNAASADDSDIVLKIDLVNDIAPHYGGYENNPLLGRVDGWENILTNKISALFRYEPKDYADILAISLHYDFNWTDIIAAARLKEAGLDSVIASEVIRTIPEEALRLVKWISEPDYTAICRHFENISLDILEGGANRLKK